jgi:hypothetical protein
MNPQYKKVGIFPDKHKNFGCLTVTVYATEVLEKHKEDPI